ncbi:PREDICTED: putative protein TPRXL [Poecilia mexicana]|uniref:putative protein TPRXL n=1 Tax=Poecilia mexicana TaxID=48701 RepID=UPI00072DBF56|nr:PREDICTED: putative protein TPRXL [Poecilia mexicana]
MLSLDEPLDLKLPSGRMGGPVKFGKRSCPSSICAPLHTSRPRLQYTTFPSPPSSPDSQSSQERPGCCFTPPAMDLSMSPSSQRALSLSPSPSSPSSPCPPSPLESPHSSSSSSSSSPQPHLFSRVRAAGCTVTHSDMHTVTSDGHGSTECVFSLKLF